MKSTIYSPNEQAFRNIDSDTPPFPAILGRTQWTMMCLSSRLW